MSRTFDEEGTYTFAFTLHPGLTGAVVVGDAEPASAMSPLSNGGADASASGALVEGIGLGLLAGLGAGWTLRRSLTARRRLLSAGPLPVLAPGQQQGRRWPSSSSCNVRRIRRPRGHCLFGIFDPADELVSAPEA